MRDYLDDLELYDTKIILMSEKESEMEVTLGSALMEYFKQQFKKKRISVLNETRIKSM